MLSYTGYNSVYDDVDLIRHDTGSRPNVNPFFFIYYIFTHPTLALSVGEAWRITAYYLQIIGSL
jgi:hypothetical protein